VSPQKVTISNKGRGLTSQAGLIPAVKFLNRYGLEGIIKKSVRHRRGDNALYDAVDGVILTVIAIIGGADDLQAVKAVWADRVLRKLSGWVSIPDNSTFGRLFRSFRQRHVVQLETVNQCLRGRIWKEALRRGTSSIAVRSPLLIDVDSTEKTAWGKQEGVKKGYNPRRMGRVSYHPLLAFCSETKEILQGWLRSGNAYTGNGVVDFMKQLLAHLPSQQRIFFRGDSGFFNGRLFDLLEERGHGYLVKVKLKNMKKHLAGLPWEAIPGQHEWEQTEFLYKCDNWENGRRFVALRLEKEPQPGVNGELFEVREYEYFCYVTTGKLDPWETHRQYGKRATCETWIDEAKNQMALGHIKMNDFWGSSALFQCGILAYNTLRWMALCSNNRELRQWEPGTIRTFLVRVAGKLRTGSRQLGLITPESCLYPEQWKLWVSVGLG